MMRGWREAGLGLLALLAVACDSGSDPNAPEGADDPAHLTPDEALAAERDALSRCGDVTPEGYCGVRFGMPAAEATRAFPVTLEGYETQAGVVQSPNRCHELFAVPPVTGISFMAEGGVITRIDVISESARTPDGFGVGTQALAIRTRFGDALGMESNAFESDITDLSIMRGAAKFVFEIQDGLVRSWRAGLMPSIDYVAHCA